MTLEALKELSGVLYPFWQLALFLIFAGIVAWSFWPTDKRRKEMRDHAEIPFKDENGRI